MEYQARTGLGIRFPRWKEHRKAIKRKPTRRLGVNLGLLIRMRHQRGRWTMRAVVYRATTQKITAKIEQMKLVVNCHKMTAPWIRTWQLGRWKVIINPPSPCHRHPPNERLNEVEGHLIALLTIKIECHPTLVVCGNTLSKYPTGGHILLSSYSLMTPQATCSHL